MDYIVLSIIIIVIIIAIIIWYLQQKTNNSVDNTIPQIPTNPVDPTEPVDPIDKPNIPKNAARIIYDNGIQEDIYVGTYSKGNIPGLLPLSIILEQYGTASIKNIYVPKNVEVFVSNMPGLEPWQGFEYLEEGDNKLHPIISEIQSIRVK